MLQETEHKRQHSNNYACMSLNFPYIPTNCVHRSRSHVYLLKARQLSNDVARAHVDRPIHERDFISLF